MELDKRGDKSRRLHDFGHLTVPASLQADPENHVQGASGAAAVRTFAARSGMKHVIYGYQFSYDAAPAAGTTIKIQDAGDTVYEQAITGTGIGPVTLPLPIRGRATNTAMVVTLSAPGGAVVGRLDVFHEAVQG